MRFRAWYRLPYTADVYDYTIANDANGTLQYTFKKTIKVDFGNDPTSPRIIVWADQPLRKRIILANIKDRNGVALLPGAQYTITSVVPVVSVFGTREGFSMQAALTNDPEFAGF